MRLVQFLLIVTLGAFSQQTDSWEICRGKKILAKGMENASVPEVNISGDDTTAIVIRFKESSSNIQWKRNFIFRSSTDSIIYQYSFSYSSGTFRLPVKGITSIFQKHGRISLVTEQHPLRDDVMARSKMLPIAYLQNK